MARLSCIVLLLLGARGAAGAAATATDTFTATLPTATETFTLPTTAATSTETYTLPTATFTLPTGGETATHTFTLPTSTATYDNKTIAPTSSPTSPTSSPSVDGTRAPTAPTASPSKAGDTSSPRMATLAPSKDGDTIAPTVAIVPTMSPSKPGDTIAPTVALVPTMSPSKPGDTSAPRAITTFPSRPGDTNAPSTVTTAFPTLVPSLSPSRVGDTISPTTAQPTSDTSNTVVHNNIKTKLHGKAIHYVFGGPGCTQTAEINQTITVQNSTMVPVAGGATFVFYLNLVISSVWAGDRQPAGGTCTSGGFVTVFRSMITSTIALYPQERMPVESIGFTNSTSAGRHNRPQQSTSDASLWICGEVDQAGVCVTSSPTRSPTRNTLPPNHGAEEGDDDFPGWAIALCVVLPVLAIGAAVAIYFFVCNKGGDEQGDDSGNAPDADAGPKDEQAV